MSDIRWYYGYRCKIYLDKGSLCWYGRVYVPLWHPVRTRGFGDEVVLRCGGEWVVFLSGKTHLGAMTAVHVAASRLRRVQDDWDRLSPYEREYRIW